MTNSSTTRGGWHDHKAFRTVSLLGTRVNKAFPVTVFASNPAAAGHYGDPNLRSDRHSIIQPNVHLVPDRAARKYVLAAGRNMKTSAVTTAAR